MDTHRRFTSIGTSVASTRMMCSRRSNFRRLVCRCLIAVLVIAVTPQLRARDDNGAVIGNSVRVHDVPCWASLPNPDVVRRNAMAALIKPAVRRPLLRVDELLTAYWTPIAYFDHPQTHPALRCKDYAVDNRPAMVFTLSRSALPEDSQP